MIHTSSLSVYIKFDPYFSQNRKLAEGVVCSHYNSPGLLSTMPPLVATVSYLGLGGIKDFKLRYIVEYNIVI